MAARTFLRATGEFGAPIHPLSPFRPSISLHLSLSTHQPRATRRTFNNFPPLALLRARSRPDFLPSPFSLYASFFFDFSFFFFFRYKKLAVRCYFCSRSPCRSFASRAGEERERERNIRVPRRIVGIVCRIVTRYHLAILVISVSPRIAPRDLELHLTDQEAFSTCYSFLLFVAVKHLQAKCSRESIRVARSDPSLARV